MTERVSVAGVGMVPFATPSKSDSYDVLAERAVRAALADAGLDLAAVQQAYAGYVYGDSTSGQNALYRVGMTGIPVINVNNNCSTGSSALYLARQAVASGAADCVLALGFEQMQRGALKAHWDDRPSAFTRFDEAFTKELGDVGDVPAAPRYFGAAGAAYCAKYGMDPAVFAQVSVRPAPPRR
jgi:sterol carrier protein 2